MLHILLFPCHDVFQFTNITIGLSSVHCILQYQHMLWFAGLRGAMAFALALRNTVTEVRQLFFTTTCVITISTVIFNGGMTVPVLTFLEVRKKN